MALCVGIVAAVVFTAHALNSAPSAVGRGAGTIAGGAETPKAEMAFGALGADLSRLESLVYELGDETQQVAATPEKSAWSPAAGILQARKAPAATTVDRNASESPARGSTVEGLQAEPQASLASSADANSSAATSFSLSSSAVALSTLLAERWGQAQKLVASIRPPTTNVTAHATIANISDIVNPVMGFSQADKDANAGLIMLVTDVERVVHKSLGPVDQIVRLLPQWIEPWMLLVPVGVITLGVAYYIYCEMTAVPAADGNGVPAQPADDDDDWDFLDEKRMQKLFGKPCMRGWCCCTFMVLVNQCPLSIYLVVFLAGGFWTLWSYHMIQPVLQQLMVYLYMALAIVFIAVLIILNIFATLRRAGRMATKSAEDAIGSLQEGFQAIQQGLDNVMDAINPFDDSSGDESEGSDAKEPEAPPDDSLTMEDYTCGLIPDEPKGGEPVIFNEFDRVKSRDGPGRWFHGFVVGSGKNAAEPLPCTIPHSKLKDPTAYAIMYVHVDNQTNPRRGWMEVKHITKGEPGYKTKDMALKKLQVRQNQQKWHGGRLPAMPAAPSLGWATPGAAPAASPAAAPAAAPAS